MTIEDDARPVEWHRLAVAWLRGRAADQAKTNEEYPEHAACYENWRNIVTYAQRFADELEREAPDTHPEASTPGLSDDDHILKTALEIIAVGDSRDPVETAEQALVAYGAWRAIVREIYAPTQQQEGQHG